MTSSTKDRTPPHLGGRVTFSVTRLFSVVLFARHVYSRFEFHDAGWRVALEVHRKFQRFNPRHSEEDFLS
jgi:hypothetical protein